MVGIGQGHAELFRPDQTEFRGDVSAQRRGARLHVAADTLDFVGPIQGRGPAGGMFGYARLVSRDVLVELRRGCGSGKRGVEQVGETVDEFVAELGIPQRFAQQTRADFVVRPRRPGLRRGIGQRVVLGHGGHVVIVAGHVGQVESEGEIIVLQDIAPPAVEARMAARVGPRAPEQHVVARPIRVARPDGQGGIIDEIFHVDASVQCGVAPRPGELVVARAHQDILVVVEQGGNTAVINGPTEVGGRVEEVWSARGYLQHGELVFCQPVAMENPILVDALAQVV